MSEIAQGPPKQGKVPSCTIIAGLVEAAVVKKREEAFQLQVAGGRE